MAVFSHPVNLLNCSVIKMINEGEFYTYDILIIHHKLHHNVFQLEYQLFQISLL